MGGSRGAAFETLSNSRLHGHGLVAFTFIVKGLGGLENAGNVPARISDKGTLVQSMVSTKENCSNSINQKLLEKLRIGLSCHQKKRKARWQTAHLQELQLISNIKH